MKNKTIVLVAGFIVMILIVGVVITLSHKRVIGSPQGGAAVVTNLKNATYVIVIEGSSVTMVNGVAETSVAPNSASKVITRYFGNEVTGDLNGDGIPDTAFLITQETGGSGTFYYAVVALKTQDGYKMTNAFFIGDRIAPQSTEIHSGEIYVNYAERKEGEPMTAQPSVGATKLLKVTSDGILNGLMQ